MLADLAVVLIGARSSVSGGALIAATEHDVAILMCDWRGVPVGGAYAWSNTTRVGARNRAQAALSAPRRKNAWGRVVRAKILGQAHTLDAIGRSGGNELRDIANSVRSGDPENREGLAARIYWQRLFGHEEFSRIPGSAEGRNALLNYAYTILRGHGIRAVLAAGLSPTLGVFHRGRSNPFSLVDDMIEPFRPAIDYAVAQIDVEAPGMDAPATKKHLVNASRMGFGCGRILTTEMDSLAQRFGRYVEGEVAKLDVPVWDGPEEVIDDE
ncbi:hypothetical protein GCM10010407_05900 [Rarobacter incanus]